MLQNEDISASEVAYKVGFQQPCLFQIPVSVKLWLPARGCKEKVQEGADIVSPGMDIKKQDFFCRS